MNKHKLQVVSEDTDAALAAEIAAGLESYEATAAPPKRSVRNMISDTAKALKTSVTAMRQRADELEQAKANARAEYERVTSTARAELEARLAEADADLHQLRSTMDVLEPARAQLAENAG